MTSHAQPSPTAPVGVIGLTVAAAALFLGRAFSSTTVVMTAFVGIAFLLVGILGAVVWRPRTPVVIGHLAAALVTVLAGLLISGFVLAALRVKLDAESTSVFFAGFSLIVGAIGATRRRRASNVVLLGEDLPVDDINAEVPSELDQALEIEPTPSRHRSRAESTVGRLVVVAAIAILSAAGITLSIVTADRSAQREAFVALSTVSGDTDASGQRLLTVEVNNQGLAQSDYRLQISGRSVEQEAQLTVPEDTSKIFRIKVPATAKVTVKLYRSDRPASVYRQTVSLPPVDA